MASIFQKFIDKVTEVAEDLTTIDGITMTGKMRLVLDNDGNVDFDAMWKTIQENAHLTGEVEVVALTHIDFDKDFKQYVDKDAAEQENDNPLLRAHNEGIVTAQEARTRIVELVGKVIPI